jgi:hypothetical protein
MDILLLLHLVLHHTFQVSVNRSIFHAQITIMTTDLYLQAHTFIYEHVFYCVTG